MAGEAYQIPAGSDILSYHGDPGLASGAGTQLSPIQVNPLAGVDSSLDKIQAFNQQKAILNYKKKQEDQDNLKKMLAETGGSVFNMAAPNGQKMSFTPLPDDQKVLNDKADSLRKMMVSNPGGYMFSSDYGKQKQDFDQAVSHAGLRSVAYNQYNQDAQKATDPDERQNIMTQRDQEIGGHDLSEGYMPQPWMPKLAINEGNLIKPEDIANKANWNSQQTTGTDAQGNQLYNTKETLNPSVADFRANVAPGTPAYNTASQIANGYMNVIATNPAAVEQHNKVIDAINEDYGYTPNDPHYVPHVADVQTNQDGSKKVIVNTVDPVQVAYAAMMEKHGAARKKSEINEDSGDLESDEQESRKTEAQIAKDNAETKKTQEEAQRVKDGKPSKPMTPTEIAEDKDSRVTVKRVKQVFNPARYSGPGASVVTGTEKVDGEDKQTYRTIAGVDVAKTLKDKGLKPEDWGVFIAPAGEADDLIGVERKGKLNTGAEQRTGETIPSAKQFILKNKQTGDLRLASYGKDGEKYTLQSMVDGRTAVGNAAKAKHEYKTENSKMSEEIDRNEGVWDEYDKPAASSSASNVVKPSNSDNSKVTIPTYTGDNPKTYKEPRNENGMSYPGFDPNFPDYILYKTNKGNKYYTKDGIKYYNNGGNLKPV